MTITTRAPGKLLLPSLVKMWARYWESLQRKNMASQVYWFRQTEIIFAKYSLLANQVNIFHKYFDFFSE